MKKILVTYILIITSIFANVIKEEKWPKGETFLTFLEKYSIPQKLYYDLEKEDKELCSEITADKFYYYLKENEDGTLNQVLIPVSEDIQLHLYKTESGKYKFQTLPISYREFTETIAIPVQSSISYELQKATGSAALAVNLKYIFKGVNFTKMQKGDFVIVTYTQKELLGKPLGQPEILEAMVEVGNRKYYRFKNQKDDKYYDENAKSFTKTYFFKIPLKYSRISSKFTKRRYHPVLKRYRAHLGTDFAAPRGRAIYAAGDGKVEFVGRRGGYGKTTIIRHPNGYKTLYAHQNAYKKGLRRGQRVKKGDLIGYVGSTGLSSGPHLHLGLYKNGRAIDPMRVIRKPETVGLKGNNKAKFIANAKKKIKEFKNLTQNENRPTPTRLDRMVSSTKLNPKEI